MSLASTSPAASARPRRDAEPFELPSPAERDAMVALGAWMLRYGQLDDALGLLLCCRNLWPQDAQVLRLTAQGLMQAREWGKAMTIFQELDILPQSAWDTQALLARAVTAMQLRQPAEASAYYSRYLAARGGRQPGTRA